MKGPSDHLTWDELACHDGTPYPKEWRESRAIPLSVEFENIRLIVGAPVKILSAYRSPTHNAEVGGAKNSQHMEGRALDLQPPKGWTVDKFYKTIREYAGDERSKIYGLGKYPTFVHIDIRPKPASGRLTVWQGNRAWAELKTGVV